MLMNVNSSVTVVQDVGFVIVHVLHVLTLKDLIIAPVMKDTKTMVATVSS